VLLAAKGSKGTFSIGKGSKSKSSDRLVARREGGVRLPDVARRRPAGQSVAAEGGGESGALPRVRLRSASPGGRGGGADGSRSSSRSRGGGSSARLTGEEARRRAREEVA
jgi:hypothetical protein